MLAYRGGQKAQAGTYWSVTSGEVVNLPKKGESLPGTLEERYIKAPVAAVMVLGPFIGLAYVIFLPLLTFVSVALFGGRKALAGAQSAAHSVFQTSTAPGWVPGQSYLTRGGQRPGTATAKKAGEDLIATLEEEIKTRREGEGKEG